MSRSIMLVRLLLTSGLLLALVAGLPAPAAAAGATVPVRSDAPHFWPDVAQAPDGRLTAVWKTDVGVEENEVRVATSTDGGASWSGDAVIFRGKRGEYLVGIQTAYDPTGALHLVFMAGLAEGRSIHYRRLPAGADPVAAGSWEDRGTVCGNCLTPSLVADQDGSIYLLYESPDSYLGLRRADSNGRWGPERRVSINQRIRGGLAVTPDGKIHVAFVDADNRAYYARYASYDAFNRETLAQVSTGRVGERPEIAAGRDGRVHIVWEQADSVLYRQWAGDLSEPAQVASPQPGRKDVTVTADGDGTVYVAWTADLPGASYAGIFEAQRLGDAWQERVQLAGSRSARARYQQYGQSLGGAVNLIFVEGGIVKVLPRTPGAPTPAPPPAPAPPPSPPTTPASRQPDPGTTSPAWYYFGETGHFLSGAFKSFWDASGGLPVFGYPLTEEFDESNADTGQTYTVQYLERQRFEYHPEHAGTRYAVLLGRLGVTDAAARGLLTAPAFAPVAETGGDCLYFAETGHRLCGDFRAYWENHGLEFGDPGISPAEAIALFGYPISEEFTDPTSGLTTQYFERAVFEYHPGNPEPHRILLKRLGADLIAARGW